MRQTAGGEPFTGCYLFSKLPPNPGTGTAVGMCAAVSALKCIENYCKNIIELPRYPCGKRWTVDGGRWNRIPGTPTGVCWPFFEWRSLLIYFFVGIFRKPRNGGLDFFPPVTGCTQICAACVIFVLPRAQSILISEKAVADIVPK